MPKRSTTTRKKTELKPCEVKRCFTCEGQGQLCAACRETEGACICLDETDATSEACDSCEGAGRICVEHDSPSGDLRTPPLCDFAQKAASKELPK